MDWAELGRAGAGLFRAPPELRFLCGPLEKPQKERKKAERRKKADQGPAEATQFDTRQGDDQDGDAVTKPAWFFGDVVFRGRGAAAARFHWRRRGSVSRLVGAAPPRG